MGRQHIGNGPIAPTQGYRPQLSVFLAVCKKHGAFYRREHPDKDCRMLGSTYMWKPHITNAAPKYTKVWVGPPTLQ